MKMILIVDLGSTSSQIGLTNMDGELHAKFVIQNDSKNLVENLHKKILEHLDNIDIDFGDQIDSIGFCVSGFVNHMTGEVKFLDSNITELYLKQESSKVFGKPVFVINDANAAALGEFWKGSAKNSKSILFYKIGSNIAGAIIAKGKLMRGNTGFAGDFGHGGMFQDKYECSCGLKGCIEALSSAKGIVRFFKDTFEKNPKHKAKKYFEELLDFETKDIYEIYQNNQKPKAIKELLSITLKPISMHMATLLKSLDLETIVISGGVSQMNELIIEIIRENLNGYLPQALLDKLTIKIATLGFEAPLIGMGFYIVNQWRLY